MLSGKTAKDEIEKIGSRIAGERMEVWERAKESVVSVVTRGGHVYQDYQVFKWLPHTMYRQIADVIDWQRCFFEELATENKVTVIAYKDELEIDRWILLPKTFKPTLRIL